jgi:hypothetical protein
MRIWQATSFGEIRLAAPGLCELEGPQLPALGNRLVQASIPDHTKTSKDFATASSLICFIRFRCNINFPHGSPSVARPFINVVHQHDVAQDYGSSS